MKKCRRDNTSQEDGLKMEEEPNSNFSREGREFGLKITPVPRIL